MRKGKRRKARRPWKNHPDTTEQQTVAVLEPDDPADAHYEDGIDGLGYGTDAGFCPDADEE